MGIRAAGIVTAAGSSSRMGSGIKKEYRLMPPSCGHEPETVLSASLRAFIESGAFGALVVTCPPRGEAHARAAILPELLAAYRGKLLIVPGGKTRRESVLMGLRALKPLQPATVLIHDGARPFCGPRLVSRVLDAAELYGSAVPLVPTVDTCKEVDASGAVIRHLPRARVMAVQTPQGFAFERILAAHEKVESEEPLTEFTDDSEIWQLCQGSLNSVRGDEANRKITFPGDLP
jgi:2-C-methyl-D-erythritol 4-phosphate cytidylyltransferase